MCVVLLDIRLTVQGPELRNRREYERSFFTALLFLSEPKLDDTHLISVLFSPLIPLIPLAVYDWTNTKSVSLVVGTTKRLENLLTITWRIDDESGIKKLVRHHQLL
jgi:hypothetical protein